MFPVGRYAKSISRNAHYIVAFKNPRDQLGVRNVLLQSFPTTWKDTLETFHQTTTRPYGYLVLDLHPASSDQQRLLSHLLKDEGWTRTYQKRLQRHDTPFEQEKEQPWRMMMTVNLRNRTIPWPLRVLGRPVAIKCPQGPGKICICRETKAFSTSPWRKRQPMPSIGLWNPSPLATSSRAGPM